MSEMVTEKVSCVGWLLIFCNRYSLKVIIDFLQPVSPVL